MIFTSILLHFSYVLLLKTRAWLLANISLSQIIGQKSLPFLIYFPNLSVPSTKDSCLGNSIGLKVFALQVTDPGSTQGISYGPQALPGEILEQS